MIRTAKTSISSNIYLNKSLYSEWNKSLSVSLWNYHGDLFSHVGPAGFNSQFTTFYWLKCPFKQTNEHTHKQ